ncbi:uncharacterized protein [Primulina eburnea]|uniref:uncharacterized protein n=1 Tax=Primulina eburnea TaxID=1245227 RepID=UPI003C6C3330
METLLKRFHSFRPPKLKGTESSVECESWLDDIEMLFESLDYTDERRVKLIGHQLQEVAKNRWLTTKRALEHRGTEITWNVFKADFYQRFFLVSYRKDKGAEISNLRHGQLNIEEYVAKFSILLRFAPHVAENDEATAGTFRQGMSTERGTTNSECRSIWFSDSA